VWRAVAAVSDAIDFYMTPLVSVVLPTRNRARTLEQAISSVLDQTLRDLELIVVDDHSTDDTDAILARYLTDSRVRVVGAVRHGCAAARNVGVTMARGRYIAFQDSDDEWLPRKLEKSIAALEADPEAGVFYTDLVGVNGEGHIGRFLSPNDLRLGVLINERTLDYQVYGVGIQSAVIRRECFDEVGLFDERMRRFIDLDLFIRLADRYRFLHCREPLVRYARTEHKDRITNDTQALVDARRRLLDKYRDRLKQDRGHLAMQYFKVAVATRANGDWIRTAGYLARALATSPIAPIRATFFELRRRSTRAPESTRSWTPASASMHPPDSSR
jgi:glycosyltransferase involved in cell wall biosynthesis